MIMMDWCQDHGCEKALPCLLQGVKKRGCLGAQPPAGNECGVVAGKHGLRSCGGVAARGVGRLAQLRASRARVHFVFYSAAPARARALSLVNASCARHDALPARKAAAGRGLMHRRASNSPVHMPLAFTSTCMHACRCVRQEAEPGEHHRHAAQLRRAVRALGRLIPPRWGSVRFRPLACTYSPWGCTYSPWGVRVDERAKSRKIPTRKILSLVFVCRQRLAAPTRAITRRVFVARCWKLTNPSASSSHYRLALMACARLCQRSQPRFHLQPTHSLTSFRSNAPRPFTNDR